MKRTVRSLDDLDGRPGNLPLVEALFEIRWVLQLLALVGLVVALRAFGPPAVRRGIDEFVEHSTNQTSAIGKTLWSRAGNVWGSTTGDR
jgi:hypothetical protein